VAALHDNRLESSEALADQRQARSSRGRTNSPFARTNHAYRTMTLTSPIPSSPNPKFASSTGKMVFMTLPVMTI
jgi:hypothetical protein